MIAYHASNKDFNKFSLNYVNTKEHKEQFNALWFSTDKEYIKQFGKYLYKVNINGNLIKEKDFKLCDKLCHEFCKINHIKKYKDYGISLLETEYGQKFLEFLLEKKYDGYIFSQNEGETIIIFNPNIVKIVDKLKEEFNNTFWNWFEGSKVIDEQGNPLLCFHGSSKDIEEFDLSYSGKSTGLKNNAFFFTSDKNSARAYSAYSQDIENKKDYKNFQAKINPCYLYIENPYVYDANGKELKSEQIYTMICAVEDRNVEFIDKEEFDYDFYNQIKNSVKDSLYDGIIIKNVIDSPNFSLFNGVQDTYIVFTKNQIMPINKALLQESVFKKLNEMLKRYL